jgi:hypothetical protein
MKPQWLKDLDARNDHDEFSIVANMSESTNWRLVRKKPDGSRDVFDTGVPITEDIPLDAEALKAALPFDVNISTVSDSELEELERDVRRNALMVSHSEADDQVPIPLTRIIRDASDVARDLGNHTSWLERRCDAFAATADAQGRKLARIADVSGDVKLDSVSDATGALETIRTILLERDDASDTVSIERMSLEHAELQKRLRYAESRLARIALSLFEGSPEPTPENLRGMLST